MESHENKDPLSHSRTVLCSRDSLLRQPNDGHLEAERGQIEIARGAAKNKTVVYQSAFFQTKVTVDGTDGKGKPAHNEWTGKFDGKDYAVTGDPMSDMRSYKKVDDHTLSMTIKKGGKVVGTGKIVVAADGKSRTVTTMGTNSKGKKFKNTAVYDKQ